jgi:hypothetical protein
MTEAAIAAFGVLELVDFDPIGPDHGRDDQLGDPIAPLDLEIRFTRVEQDHLDLASIVGVDRPRRIRDEYAMSERETTARSDLGLEFRGQRDA